MADKRGIIPVDDHWKTSVERIWAIGDVMRGRKEEEIGRKTEKENFLCFIFVCLCLCLYCGR